MTPAWTYDDLRRDRVRQVQVQLDGGAWVTGDLEAAPKIDGVWSGRVRYSLVDEFSSTYIGWFATPHIRGLEPQNL